MATEARLGLTSSVASTTNHKILNLNKISKHMTNEF